MRTLLGVGLALAVLSQSASGDDLKSGPDKEIGGPFQIKAVTGDNKGKSFCYV
jgi:hypothetical protein